MSLDMNWEEIFMGSTGQGQRMELLRLDGSAAYSDPLTRQDLEYQKGNQVPYFEENKYCK